MVIKKTCAHCKHWHYIEHHDHARYADTSKGVCRLHPPTVIDPIKYNDNPICSHAYIQDQQAYFPIVMDFHKCGYWELKIENPVQMIQASSKNYSALIRLVYDAGPEVVTRVAIQVLIQSASIKDMEDAPDIACKALYKLINDKWAEAEVDTAFWDSLSIGIEK